MNIPTAQQVLNDTSIKLENLQSSKDKILARIVDCAVEEILNAAAKGDTSISFRYPAFTRGFLTNREEDKEPLYPSDETKNLLKNALDEGGYNHSAGLYDNYLNIGWSDSDIREVNKRKFHWYDYIFAIMYSMGCGFK